MVSGSSLWRWANVGIRKSRRGSESVIGIELGRNERAFAADSGKRTPDGNRFWLRLVDPTETPIRRIVKIRGEANPFDPRWRAILKIVLLQALGIHRHEAGINRREPAPHRGGFPVA